MNIPTGKKRGRRGRIIWIAVAVIIAIFALRFWQLGKKETVASIRSVQEAEGKPVEVITAKRGDIEVWTTLAGTVEGCFQYPVVSTNSITVIEIAKSEGDRVKKGDVVIRLDKAAPNPMLHSYSRSKALYDDALTEAKRMRDLYDEGAVSKQMLDKAELALEVARSDLINATESVNLMATHAGVVTSVIAEEGEIADAYEPLVWIANTDSVKIVFEAGSMQAMELIVGQRAVWKSRGTGYSGRGYISKLDLAADPKTHLVSGEACFPNGEGRLMPGLLVTFDALTGERRGVVKIPRACLVGANGQGYRVYVAERGADGTVSASLREVETGLGANDDVEIVSGIEEGELVIRFGQTLLNDGDLVKIVRGGEGM
jgi:membrane fusion protein (multidrug efflux system)